MSVHLDTDGIRDFMSNLLREEAAAWGMAPPHKVLVVADQRTMGYKVRVVISKTLPTQVIDVFWGFADVGDLMLLAPLAADLVTPVMEEMARDANVEISDEYARG